MAHQLAETDKRQHISSDRAALHVPDASALAVSHNRMATKSFGMRLDLLSDFLPPGIASLWLICKTQNSESNSFH